MRNLDFLIANIIFNLTSLKRLQIKNKPVFFLSSLLKLGPRV
jgi:hypothetical protein